MLVLGLWADIVGDLQISASGAGGYKSIVGNQTIRRGGTVVTNIRTQDAERVRWVIALLLCLFLGLFGVHRFFCKEDRNRIPDAGDPGIFGSLDTHRLVLDFVRCLQGCRRPEAVEQPLSS